MGFSPYLKPTIIDRETVHHLKSSEILKTNTYRSQASPGLKRDMWDLYLELSKQILIPALFFLIFLVCQ